MTVLREIIDDLLRVRRGRIAVVRQGVAVGRYDEVLRITVDDAMERVPSNQRRSREREQANLELGVSRDETSRPTVTAGL